MSLHYLVKNGCSKFLPNTGFVTIRLLRFGVKVTRTYCHDNFLAQRPLPDMRRLSGVDFFMFQQDGTSAHQHATPSLSWSERDARNASSSRRVCPWVSQDKAVTWLRLGGKYLYSIQFQPFYHLPTKTY